MTGRFGCAGQNEMCVGWENPERPTHTNLAGPAQQAPSLALDAVGMPSTGLTEVWDIMGMPIGIDLPHAGGIDVEVAFDWLRQVDATFSTYREDSEISRLDRGELTLAECRPEVNRVLTRCLALGRFTRGYF